LERLSAHTSEINVRLMLANDFLFKVDSASMKESLEIRVPMLDEDLFAFGLSLPHRLKVNGRTCKTILREIANRKIPLAVAKKPKRGFGIPMDTWVDADFKEQVRDTLLGPTSELSDLFRPEAYRLGVEAFCNGRRRPDMSREGLYQTIIMLLSLQLALGRGRYPRVHSESSLPAGAMKQALR
jgi:asparagine synthase (glutamine-hydrolysing)